MDDDVVHEADDEGDVSVLVVLERVAEAEASLVSAENIIVLYSDYNESCFLSWLYYYYFFNKKMADK